MNNKTTMKSNKIASKILNIPKIIKQSEIDYRYIMSSLVYRTFSMKHTNINKLIDLANRWVQQFINREIMKDGKVIADETIWLPTEPENYGKLIRFYIRLSPVLSYVVMEVNLNRDIFSGVSLINNCKIPINLFEWAMSERDKNLEMILNEK